MILHYLKIAWRNLLKYRTQTVVSILGLAVGFACFALSTIWIRYELTFDAFQPEAGRTYVVFRKMSSSSSVMGMSGALSYNNLQALRNKVPEVEAAGCLFQHNMEVTLRYADANLGPMQMLLVDSGFVRMFGIELLRGDYTFISQPGTVAIEQQTALRCFGTLDVVGRRLIETEDGEEMEMTIGAVVSGWRGHSNYPFQLLGSGQLMARMYEQLAGITDLSPDVYSLSAVLVRLRPHTDISALEAKLDTVLAGNSAVAGYRLIPLTQLHYSNPEQQEGRIRFDYLFLFAATGLLVILASLANYLTLYATRLQMRRREVALRKVNGASSLSIIGLLLTEFGLLLLMAGFVGQVLIELVGRPFHTLSGVEGSVYGESLLYFVSVAAVSVLFFVPVCLRHYRVAAADAFRGTTRHSGRAGLFRRGGLVLQLFVSLLFIFCVSVLLKQLYYLRTADFGLERRNIAVISSLYPAVDFTELGQRIEALPGVRQVLSGQQALVPLYVSMGITVDGWNEAKPDEKLNLLAYMGGEDIIQFYGIRLLEGDFPRAQDRMEVIVNESAARALGMAHPVGQTIGKGDDAMYICGVVKDFRVTAPTLPVKPCVFYCVSDPSTLTAMGGGQVLIKYEEGCWPDLRRRIRTLLKEHYPGTGYVLDNMEDIYNGFLKSETALLSLVSVLGGVCVLISVFGIFSMITLSCERRRKEIAIRKVNGARVGDILRLFAREYLLLLVVAAAVAFPVGYVLMKRWLESYVEQTVISWWLYALLFLAMALLVALCIGWRVWRAANENPGEVVKRE